MVKAARLWRRMSAWVSADLRAGQGHLRALWRPPAFAPGLYHYPVVTSEGRLRLHLRLHPNRTGLLFINAVETIHLPPRTAEMVKLALDGIPRSEALAQLSLAYPAAAPDLLAAEFDRLAAAIGRLQQPAAGCRVCDFRLPQPPPFSVRAQAPHKADLALHYACNNRCAHCYNEPGRRQMPSLSTAQWREVLRRLWDIGVPYVIFTGGEPTLRPDLVELVAYAESLGQITGLNTNGRRLSDPGLTRALAEAGLDHVQITLNSHRPQRHNSISGASAFAETVAGLRCALDCGLHVLTNTTLLQDNAAEALDLVDFLHDLGVRTFAMNGLIHAGCGARHAGSLSSAELASLLARVRDRAAEHGMRFLWYTPTRYCRLSPVELGLGLRCCNAAEYSICVEPNGDVLPCQSYYLPAGNLLADPWEMIWDSPLFRRFRDRREQPEHCGLPPDCWECEQLRVCGGGCALERETDGG